MTQKAAAVGFDWRAAVEVVDKIREEIDELESEPQKAIAGGLFRRRADVEPYKGNPDLKQVDVWIRWTDGASGKERALVLRALRGRREGE